MSIPIAGPSKDASKALPALQLEKDPDRPTSKQLTALFKDYKPEYDPAAYRPGVERCRISCKQTEAQRLAKQEPDCSGYCYLVCLFGDICPLYELIGSAELWERL